ncbi:MAG: DUF1631 family protein [Pseudomonadales bacterium]|nr:DUF1631 family protein [Pseudomonadales bacterium]
MDPKKRSAIDRHSSSLQALALDLAFTVLDEFFEKIDVRLMEEVDAAANQQQWQVLSLARSVKDDKAKLSQLFENEIMEGFVLFRLGRLGGENTQVEDQSISLSLVANEELERDLALNSLARRAETRHSESLFALNQRLAVVNGGKKLAEDGNPLSPAQFANALAAMLSPLELPTKFLVFFSRVFEPILIHHLERLYSQCNAYLIDTGILPNLRYTISKKSQPTSAAQKVEPETQADTTAGANDKYYQQAKQHLAAQQPQVDNVRKNARADAAAVESAQASSVAAETAVNIGDRTYQQQMFNAIRQLQNTSSGSPNAENQQVLSALTVAPTQQLVSGLNGSADKQGYAEALESDHVHALTVAHYEAVAQQIRAEVGADHRVDSDDSHTIDLVGMIFEYMLGDELLPDSLKAVLSYLHTPFIKIALLDPEFFEYADHPARKLLNLLADTGRRWVNSDGDSQFKIFPKIKAMVRRAVLDSSHELALYEELLVEMQEFHAKIQHKIALLETRAKEKAQGEERLRDAKRRVYSEVKQRIGSRNIPPAVTVLLLHPWADFLTFELLRFGEDSTQWRDGLQLVDDILWSILLKHSDDECSKLILMQPGMLGELKEAIKSISFNQPKALKLIAILEDLQNQSLLVLGVSQADPNVCANKNIHNVDDVILHSRVEGSEEFTEETYPDQDFEEPDESLYNAAEKEMVDHLRHIDFGTQFEFDEINGRKKQRLKVAWYNINTMRYMLVDNAGCKVTMTSGIEIARMILACHARIISGSTKPFFERALENILVRLKGMHI